MRFSTSLSCTVAMIIAVGTVTAHPGTENVAVSAGVPDTGAILTSCGDPPGGASCFGAWRLRSILQDSTFRLVTNPPEWMHYPVVVLDGYGGPPAFADSLRAFLQLGHSLVITGGSAMFIAGGQDLSGVSDIFGADRYVNGGADAIVLNDSIYGLPWDSGFWMGTGTSVCSQAGMALPVLSVSRRVQWSDSCVQPGTTRSLFSYLFDTYLGRVLFVSMYLPMRYANDDLTADLMKGALPLLRKGLCVTSLSVIDEADSLHVVSHIPDFGWGARTFDSSAQTSFEIKVGSDSTWILSDMWDPGEITSSDKTVRYSGSPLQDGTTYNVRLRLFNGTIWSPWFHAAFRLDTPPTVPLSNTPRGDTVLQTSFPWLILTNSADAEGDSLHYDYQVFADSGLTLLVDSASHVPETPVTTHWVVTQPLSDDGRFWWRTRAFDGFEYSPWSTPASFRVNVVEEAPSAPVLLAPPENSGLPVFNLRPTLHWIASSDPDPGDSLHYRVDLSLNSIFQPPSSYENIYADSLLLPDSLEFGTRYWWRVRSIDRTGLYAVSVPSKSFWTWQLGDVDHSHNTDIVDLTKLIDYLYISFTPITPPLVADLDGDCHVDISDLTRLIDHLYISFRPLGVGCE